MFKNIFKQKHDAETRRYITPYAFTVEPSLLGRRLASPGKRFLGILIDLAVIAILSTLAVKELSFVIALACLVAVIPFVSPEIKKMERLTLLLVASIAIAVICVGVVIERKDVEMPIEINIGSEQQAEPNSIDSSVSDDEEPGFFKRLEGITSELGEGLGLAALYFSFFTKIFTGRTMGKLVTGTQIVKISDQPITWWESFERYGGYSAGVATGTLGFLQVIWDPNRQAIHDKVSETVVVDLRKPSRLESKS